MTPGGKGSQPTPVLLGEAKSSDEEKAVDVLRRFMCCKAGEQFVDEKLLRPFGFTLDSGPVVRTNRNLIDALEWIEAETGDQHVRDAARRAVDAASTQPVSEAPGNSGEGTDRERADRLEVECAELEDANRCLTKLRDRALEGKVAVADQQPSDDDDRPLGLLREDDALVRLALYVFRFTRDFDQAVTEDTAMSAALDHVAAALESTDRTPDQIRESLEAEAGANRTQPVSGTSGGVEEGR